MIPDITWTSCSDEQRARVISHLIKYKQPEEDETIVNMETSGVQYADSSTDNKADKLCYAE